MLSENPVKNNSREELVFYMCTIHNIVNKRLGKQIFDCNNAMNYWGGDCGCSAKRKNNNNLQ